MKVVILGPVAPFRGGIVAYSTLLARAMASRDEIHLLSFRRQYPRWLYPGHSDQDPSQLSFSLPVKYLVDTINPMSWFQASGWLERSQPDLLVIQWWVTYMAPAFAVIAGAARKSGIPVLFVVHNAQPHEPRWFDTFLARLALRQGDIFLCHTPQEEQRLAGLVPGAKVRNCPLPVYDGLVDPAYGDIDRSAARRKYNLPEDAKVLLFFGIVRPYKGLAVLLQSAALLHAEGLPVHVLITGEFWEDRRIYQQLIRQLSLEEFAHIHDRYLPEKEVAAVFTAADAAVFPYTGGTQSGAAALAEGYGIPLVLTERSAAGISPIMLESMAVAQSGDPQSLAQAIRYRLEHPRTVSRGSESGWQLVLETIDGLLQQV